MYDFPFIASSHYDLNFSKDSSINSKPFDPITLQPSSSIKQQSLVKSTDSVRFDKKPTSAPEIITTPERATKTIVSNPKTIVTNPKTIVSNPKTIVTAPKTIVSNPKTIVTAPKTIVSNPKTIVTNPKIIVSNPKTIVTAPKTIVNAAITVVTTPKTIVTNPKTITQNHDVEGFDVYTEGCKIPHLDPFDASVRHIIKIGVYRVYPYVCVRVYVSVCMCPCVCVRVYVSVCMCPCVCVRVNVSV